MAELPVPIVAAVCNELRQRGVVDRARPVRLTPAGRALLGRPAPGAERGLPGLRRHAGSAVPAALAGLQARLERAAAGAPGAKPELDQTHCTVGTKIRRVLRMHEAGALAGRRILLLGDDDLISVAIAAFARGPGGIAAGVERLTVVDSDPEVLAWAGEQIAGTAVAAELVEHDLRRPLPAGLAGAFDVACTDPPYTVAGAELFLSRAVDGAGRRARPARVLLVRRPPAGRDAARPGADRRHGADRPRPVAGLQHLPRRRGPGRHQPPVPPAQHRDRPAAGRGRVHRRRCTRRRPGRPPPGRTGARAAGRCTRSARAAAGRGSPRCRRPAARSAAARCSGRCPAGRARARGRHDRAARGRRRAARLPDPPGHGRRSRRDRRVRGGDRPGVVRRRGDHRRRAAPQAGRGRARQAGRGHPGRGGAGRAGPRRSAGPGCRAGRTR